MTGLRGVLLDFHLVALRCAAPLALRALPLPTLFRLIDPRRGSMTEARAMRAIARSERLAPRLRAPNTCLYRAMARFVALRSAGVEARFRMGVHAADPDTAHAWVEVDGVPVGEEADERLVPTYSFP